MVITCIAVSYSSSLSSMSSRLSSDDPVVIVLELTHVCSSLGTDAAVGNEDECQLTAPTCALPH